MEAYPKVGFPVIALLARRYGIEVALSGPNRYGGMRASVFIPEALLTSVPTEPATAHPSAVQASRRARGDGERSADPAPPRAGSPAEAFARRAYEYGAGSRQRLRRLAAEQQKQSGVGCTDTGSEALGLMTVQANDSSNRLGWMLNDLANMPEARFVVLLAADGMSMAYSESVDRDTADSVAASASGFHSIGVALAPFCGGKDNGLRQVVGEFDDGYLFVKTAGANTLLAVATTAFADAGVVTHRMNELAGRSVRNWPARRGTTAAKEALGHERPAARSGHDPGVRQNQRALVSVPRRPGTDVPGARRGPTAAGPRH